MPEFTARLEKETKNYARYKMDEPCLGTLYIPYDELKEIAEGVPDVITVEIKP